MTDIHGKVSTHQAIDGKLKTSSAVDGGLINDAQINAYQAIDGKMKTSSAVKGGLDNEVKDRIVKDYNPLRNHPSIEGEELIGDKPLEAFGITRVLYGTKEEWNSKPLLISTEHTLYVYTNYDEDEHGNLIAGFKLGDGNSYLIDSPFLDENYYAHIRDNNIHITPEERKRWNEHVRCETTEYWENHPLQTTKGCVYVYTDYQQIDNNDVPGVKIGDGNAFLADLPFLDAVYAKHIADTVIHVTQADRDRWDNKVTCYLDNYDDENLVFSKE